MHAGGTAVNDLDDIISLIVHFTLAAEQTFSEERCQSSLIRCNTKAHLLSTIDQGIRLNSLFIMFAGYP